MRECSSERGRGVSPLFCFFFAAILCAGCGAGSGVSTGTFSGDWPMFRGGPARLGVTGDAAQSELPDKPPTVGWVFTDGKPNAPVTFWSSPAVAGGRLYVGGGVLSVFGTRGYIYCLDSAAIDPATGKPRILWRHKTEKLVFSSPSLAGGTLLCGEGTHTDTDAGLYALDAGATGGEGRRLWEFKVPGTVEASPCVGGPGGKCVYFGTGDDFHCLDLATGRPRWKATIVDVLSSPVAAGGAVYVGAGRSEQARPENRHLAGQQLLALDAATGDVLWRQTLKYPCSSPITFAAGAAGGVSPSGDPDRLVAGSGKGTFIVTGARSAGEVICHEAKTGVQLWSRPMPDNVLAAIPVRDGLVHVACRDGKYYLLSLADGAVLWEYDCTAPLLASPVVSGGRVLLMSCKGVAHCLDFKARSALWRLDLPQAAGLKKTAEAFSSPVLAGGRIYIGLGNLGLVCLQPAKP